MPRKIIKQGCDFQDFTDPTECYLGYQDLVIQGLKEVVVTIKSLDVDSVPVPMSGKSENKVVATLAEHPKGLIISKGKRKALTTLFGPPSNWIGKQIKLVADPSRKWRGQIVGGLAIEKVK
jgi:hypothetical protein